MVTPERIALTMDAASVVVPGVEGSLGVLANHAPLMAELAIGEVIVRDAAGKETNLAISDGFMEMCENQVRILVNTAETSTEIDVARAQEAKKRAEERLAERRDDIDKARAEASLKRALVRLRISGRQ